MKFIPDESAEDASEFTLRRFEPLDGPRCLRLFRETVHRVNQRDYSPEQLAAWVPDDLDAAAWTARFYGKVAYLAWQGEVLCGFADMSIDGYLDRLFVSADHQRHGIAKRLLQKLTDDAKELNCDRITTDASITAKPFFLASGFRVVRQQEVICRGVELTNFRMERSLRADR